MRELELMSVTAFVLFERFSCIVRNTVKSIAYMAALYNVSGTVI